MTESAKQEIPPALREYLTRPEDRNPFIKHPYIASGVVFSIVFSVAVSLIIGASYTPEKEDLSAIQDPSYRVQMASSHLDICRREKIEDFSTFWGWVNHRGICLAALKIVSENGEGEGLGWESCFWQ